VIVQRPAETSETVVVATVQTGVVEEAKVTVSPEVDEAEIEKELIPRVLFARASNEMVCAALFTVTVLVVVAVS
jgi:hypothetical protein